MNHPEMVLVDCSAHVPKGKALDLGCGYVRNSLYLARKGFYVEATSLPEESVAGVKDTKRRCERYPFAISACRPDGEDMTFFQRLPSIR